MFSAGGEEDFLTLALQKNHILPPPPPPHTHRKNDTSLNIEHAGTIGGPIFIQHDGKFDLKMLRIARICVFGVFTISFFVKNREHRPDKNKFAFTLDKLTMELDEIQ